MFEISELAKNLMVFKRAFTKCNVIITALSIFKYCLRNVRKCIIKCIFKEKERFTLINLLFVMNSSKRAIHGKRFENHCAKPFGKQCIALLWIMMARGFCSNLGDCRYSFWNTHKWNLESWIFQMDSDKAFALQLLKSLIAIQKTSRSVLEYFYTCNRKLARSNCI